MPSTATSTASSDSKTTALNRYPWYSPRFWHGMRVRAYFGMLFRNRLRIHPARWHMALAIAPVTFVNSFFYRVQNLFYGRRIRNTEIEHPPIFIVGHWRSGTTHLHELLVRDERFTFPTTYECFAPNHFLISDWCAAWTAGLFMPRVRPMDNMQAGLERPQEDEFALCGMGAPTPYLRMAFPNRPEPFGELYNTDEAGAADLERFKTALLRFVKTITVRRKQTVVLKSPPHTGRIGELAKLFPGARFIHIVRDPYATIPSTQRLWHALDTAQGFQIPRHATLDDLIFSTFNRMYAGFEHQREEIPDDRLCEVRYEDLVENPLGQMERIYRELDLGDFESARPGLESYLSSQKGYQPNRHKLSPDLKSAIDQNCGSYQRKYGYD
ncbi:MAG: sulfotransferase [Planctomycetota bacterium]|nr:sulfotransferase [Planctomycetota bacterium]